MGHRETDCKDETGLGFSPTFKIYFEVNVL